MKTVRAREIEEQAARAGGDGKSECAICHKPRRALCVLGELEYDDGSLRECPNYMECWS